MNARSSTDETVGVFDPLGRPAMFLANDGTRITISKGPAAEAFPWPGLPPLRADGVSLGRILSGAPGCSVEVGVLGRTADGEWVFDDGRQTLFSDRKRRTLARAEYEFSGKRVAVSYPGRKGLGPPAVVTIEAPGANILLRRDTE